MGKTNVAGPRVGGLSTLARRRLDGQGVIMRRPRLMMVCVLAVSVAACGGSVEALQYVDLSVRQQIPPAFDEDGVLRVAVAAVLSPEANIASYTELAQYLGDRLDKPVELVQRRTYAEVNDLVARGAVDLAFVCTSAYVVGSDRGEMELLVIPEVNGETVYHSVIIVSSDAEITGVEDLRGKIFAFTDPMSNTGRVYPTYLLQQMGETPESFFAGTIFTYSHDRAIAAVASGVADAAAVDSLVLDFAMDRDPSLSSRLKVIHRSPAFGIPPVVVPVSIDAGLRAELESLLLGLEDQENGGEILAQLGADRFVLGDESIYDGVRMLVEAVDVHP